MANEFRISDTETIFARSEKTRSGFRHLVSFFKNGSEIESAKVCYINRTWESYAFETAIRKLLEKMDLDDARQEQILSICSGKSRDETNAMFASVARVASLGEIFATTPKEKNDWKSRMLKAGLPQLDIPEDWETLDETEKGRRLDLVISHLKGVRV